MVKMILFPMDGRAPKVLYINEYDVHRIKEIINTEELHCWKIVGENDDSMFYIIFGEDCLSVNGSAGVNLCIPRYCPDLLLAIDVEYICGNVIVCQTNGDQVIDMDIDYHFDENPPDKSSEFI